MIYKNNKLYFNKRISEIKYESDLGSIKITTAIKSDDVSTFTYALHGIIGIIEVDSKYFLLIISNTETIGSFNSHNVYRVKEVEYINLTDNTGSLTMDTLSEFIEDNNFYFTYSDIKDHFLWNKNVKSNFIRGIKDSEKSTKSNIMSKRSPFSRIKNESSIAKINKKDNKLPFSIEFIGNELRGGYENFLLGNLFCGYFLTEHVIRSDKYIFTICSMISTNKIGPRMLCRGVDDEGNSSFFVKTYFNIIKNDALVFDFDIFRGSVPLYWSQHDPLKPTKIWFNNDISENEKAFKKHFNLIDDVNKKLIVIDLLGSRKYEAVLSKMYKNYCVESAIKYMNFNLHKYISDFELLKNTFFEKFSLILNDDELVVDDRDIEDSSEFSEFDSSDSEGNTCASINEDTIRNSSCDHSDGLHKKYSIRVNCLDCLDRTNLCQYLVFEYFNPYKFKEITKLWKNNGDALAKLNSGSNALMSDLIGSDKKLSIYSKVSDMYNNAHRFINNKFNDKEKERIINLLLKGSDN